MSGEPPEANVTDVPIAKRRLTIWRIMLGIAITAPFLHPTSLTILIILTYVLTPFASLLVVITGFGERLRREDFWTWFLFWFNVFLVLVGYRPLLSGHGPNSSVDHVLMLAPVLIAALVLWLVLTLPRTKSKPS